MAQEIVSLLLHFNPGVSEDIIIAFYAGYFLNVRSDEQSVSNTFNGSHFSRD